ncbi:MULTISPECIES: cobyrinate a,c-diamide synthase [Metallosphaera]|uniref:cobyrinate a,c-diamide synthase n=1 Tax=Metallosphaera TaxID=41980 RepID=UPI001F05A924|nr:cobyrinate a,c-diamide synthase [Metallosphaera sedula]MCH1771831.1 cobyrinate a,c-diamide synthase [Metallosphaera sedula]MCP6729160.1 cobyrinate a,c-diamide synthase [Metallosphaera sedula]
MLPRVLVSADRSGTGKTLVTSGIMKALSKRMNVRGFKVGPDYIDTGYHKLATGRPSINLDLFMMGEEGVKKSLVKYSRGSDISVIEGVMGLYDGHGIEYSTYRLSQATQTPIILVLDCSSMGTTAAALIHGLKSFGNANIKGVIFNKIASEHHYSYCREKVTDVKVLGYIPRINLTVPSRHLGLFTIETYNKAMEAVEEMSRLVESFIDLDEIVNIASEAPDIQVDLEDDTTSKKKGIMAIAYDSAFSFYYQENLDILSKFYTIKLFSPINNETVDEADFIYLGGGYPELFPKELSESYSTIKWIRESVYSGIPVIAECGGLMYLSSYIRTKEGKFPMVSVYDIGISMGKLTLGYRMTDILEDIPLGRTGDIIRGHEFHTSSPEYVNEKRFTLKHRNGKGIQDGFDGVRVNNAIGSYLHAHLASLRLSL